MKLARLLLIVAVFGVYCSVARADGTDPHVFTSGCGETGQPPCDVYYLEPGQTTISNARFNFAYSSYYGADVAFIDIIDRTGQNINNFTMSFSATDNLGTLLSYACNDTNGSIPGGTGGFLCSPVEGEPDTFLFTGFTLCTEPSTYYYSEGVGEEGPGYSGCGEQPTCQYGERIGLLDPTNTLEGDYVTGTFTAPEPGAGILLLFGIVTGSLVGLKRRILLA